MNPSWCSAVGILVVLIGVANGAALQKRWIPERMSDNDYGYDNQQHQTTSDDLAAYQPNYMSYWTDYFPGGYSGGDYSGMLYRAGGQAPPQGQVMMDPVQQLQYVQAYSYAQQLQQQYPNGVPLPYRPQPSPYQPYQPYQPQPGVDASGRSLASLLNINALNRQQTLMTNKLNSLPQSHLTSFVQPQSVVLAKEPQKQVFEVVEVDPMEASDIQSEGILVELEDSNPQQFIVESSLLESLQEVQDQNEQNSEVLDASFTQENEQLLEALAEVVAAKESQAQSNTHSHDKINKHSQTQHETQQEILDEVEAEVLAAEIKQLQKEIKDDQKKIQKTHSSGKTPQFIKSRAGPGGSGDYIDPNMYANYGGDSGLVDMASPLDLIYPGAMVHAPSYSPVTPTYYPYAPPNPYLIPQQVYQPSGYNQASSGPYGAPAMPYSTYPTMPSYYNVQPPLRYARNSAATFPMPVVVKYMYGAAPMQLAHSG